MTNRGKSEGIRIVGDFVCDVIPYAPKSVETPASRGRSEGVHVIGEFVVDLGTHTQDDTKEDDGHKKVIG